TENNWKRKFKGIPASPLISKEGDYAVFLNSNDSLVIVPLGKSLVQYIPNVGSFTMCQNEVSEWIAYQFEKNKKQLIFQNLKTHKKYTYNRLISKVMGDDGKTVILQTEKKNGDRNLQELKWIDLPTGKSTLIWEGVKAKDILLDLKHHKLAFTSEIGLFTYDMTSEKLNCLINQQMTHLDSGLIFERIKQFSNDGDMLFIELKGEKKIKPKPGLIEIWSYLDHKLQTQQESEIESRVYAAVINLTNGKIIRLESEFEHLGSNIFKDESSDTIRILYHDSELIDGFFGNRFDLIFLKSGRRIPLKYRPEGISPNGKYIVYFDPEQHSYISYNTQTKLSHVISNAFLESGNEQGLVRAAIAGWLDDDESVLFYDSYDIWKMDLSGQKTPVNLTAGYGRKHDFVFNIIFGQGNPCLLRKDQKIILTAFNLKSKQNGFYSIGLEKVKKIELLSIGNYLYCSGPHGVVIDDGGWVPIKAKNAKIYIVSRMSAKEAPNYFSTKDFKTFRALSNLHPEREYNWYTSELHTWTSLDGRNLQGILYKPEDFDPTKKYPVIFHYYETKSNNLNAYIKPEPLSGCCNIDIPTYVNNGYLIFIPDIIYKIGDPMQGTYNSVVSAAKYVSTLPFVNPRKMGIQGCSWGGIQTNYLVTHTNLFSAACSASGIADWIGSYGRLSPSGASYRSLYEAGQIRMGKTIWEIPDAYIKNSPIFQLDKITTPLLIMHTKKDSACPYEDAIEFFTGLRRLGKRSWLLAYSEGNHGVWGKEAKDFSTRMMQFFDHYLKDKPAPIWMTRGISAERRGLDDGLAYDTKIKTPGPGLLTPEEQKTVDSLMTRKPILIELK
ncbi:hypothetical protein DBR11_19175, partial [Pedobacter sp. HMWF019]|uniref:alpha/beta hydrolase family protein n=1 Tax=Pedobacter sp. HMWF019 TaxID=2056856 RepID=UPI000D35D554